MEGILGLLRDRLTAINEAFLLVGKCGPERVLTLFLCLEGEGRLVGRSAAESVGGLHLLVDDVILLSICDGNLDKSGSTSTRTYSKSVLALVSMMK